MPLSRAEREKGVALLENVREFLPAGVEDIRAMDDSEFQLIFSSQY